MYAANLILHKDVDNDLFFQFKNSDQRRINIGNKNFRFIMFDDRNLERQIVIELPMTITDATTGKATVTVPEQYLYHVETGQYEYSIISEDLSGHNHATYVDDNFGMRGIVEVKKGAGPIFRASDTLTFDTITNLTDVVSDLTSLNQNNALHTTLVKFGGTSGYTGTLVIQGTLDNIIQQTTNVNFFDIATIDFLDQVDNATLNFNGVYNGIRFLQGVTSGEITEIQHRY